MTISFRQLLERLEPQHRVDTGEDRRAISAIRSGNDLRSDDDTSFWDDFLNLCVNADGLSDLLGVEIQSVRQWPKRVREARAKAESEDASAPGIRDDHEMLPTGDNGAVVINSE